VQFFCSYHALCFRIVQFRSSIENLAGLRLVLHCFILELFMHLCCFHVEVMCFCSTKYLRGCAFFFWKCFYKLYVVHRCALSWCQHYMSLKWQAILLNPRRMGWSPWFLVLCESFAYSSPTTTQWSSPLNNLYHWSSVTGMTFIDFLHHVAVGLLL